jgi:hypothetical protein
LATLALVAGAATLWAQDQPEPRPAGVQVIVTTADDEQTAALLTGVAEGRLQLATDPPREVALADLQSIAIGSVDGGSGGGDLAWIGQDNHDLVQVGSPRGGNGIQDIHLHAVNLRAVPIKQVLVVCRFPSQLRVWQLDTSQSPHWRLAIARSETAPEAELYLEPPGLDSFGQKFEVTYTYDDGIKVMAAVMATTHTADKLKLDRAARAGSLPKPRQPASAVASPLVYLADGDVLHGEIKSMTAESLTLVTRWKAEVEIPLVRARGIWLGVAGPAGAQAEFDRQLAAPADADTVFAVGQDKQPSQLRAAVRGLADGKLQVDYEGQERAIHRDRVLGVVFAAHPPLARLPEPAQVFVLVGGDQLTGHWAGYDDARLEVETAWNARLHVPAAEVTQIRVRGGRATSLVDLEPSEVEETPYFGRVIAWRRDQGFDGEPAKLRGKPPRRSIAMHSRSRLTYPLDGQFEKFKATLGFDDSAGNRGRVDCRVLVDGREAFTAQDFRATQDPIAVEIPLAGAKQLSLEVDFGPDQDVGDRILWAEPRLFRTPTQ